MMGRGMGGVLRSIGGRGVRLVLMDLRSWEGEGFVLPLCTALWGAYSGDIVFGFLTRGMNNEEEQEM